MGLVRIVKFWFFGEMFTDRRAMGDGLRVKGDCVRMWTTGSFCPTTLHCCHNSHLVQPLLDVVEGLGVCDVVDYNDTVCCWVEGGGWRVEVSDDRRGWVSESCMEEENFVGQCLRL